MLARPSAGLEDRGRRSVRLVRAAVRQGKYRQLRVLATTQDWGYVRGPAKLAATDDPQSNSLGYRPRAPRGVQSFRDSLKCAHSWSFSAALVRFSIAYRLLKSPRHRDPQRHWAIGISTF